MKILVNASNLRTGGALQVAESIVRLLNDYKEHEFVVVLPSSLQRITKDLARHSNIKVIPYTQKLSLSRIITGRDHTLDGLVKDHGIEAVLSVFGPSRWRPKCFHLAGFAMPHVVLPYSPYWKTLTLISFLKTKLRVIMMKRDFHKNNDSLWCENEYISHKLRKIFKDKEIRTITNNYNQVFDNPSEWDNSIKLPSFDGITLLTITANFRHKNLHIAIPTLKILKQIAPDLNVRFVYTITQDEFGTIPVEFKDNFVFTGSITINQCPPLYQQADIMFQPSLLECFSATYAEAMKMEVPILTTDLGFAHSLCGDSAYYYSATDPESLAKGIIELSSNEELRTRLIENGIQRLTSFDSVEQRVKKILAIIEKSKPHNVSI